MDIKKKYGKKPITIATDAKIMNNMVSYSHLKAKIQGKKDPYLIIFGTGWGLSNNIIQSCDYILKPVGGYNE